MLKVHTRLIHIEALGLILGKCLRISGFRSNKIHINFAVFSLGY